MYIECNLTKTLLMITPSYIDHVGVINYHLKEA